MKIVASKEERWQGNVGLAFVLLVALILRLGLASLPRVIRWDEPDYLWLGRSFWLGHGYTITGVPELHYTPLYPLLVGPVYILTGNPELASAFWYVLLGGMLVLPIYFIGRRLYGARVALVGALLVALFPGLSSAILYWGTMTEPLFIFLVYCAAWLALIALDEGRWWAFVGAGGLFSLAYLARPEGVVWFVAFGVLFLLVWALRGTKWRWHNLLWLGGYLAVFILIALPYMLFLYRHTGKLMTTGKLSITYNIGEAVLERDPVLYDKVTASLDKETGEILWWSHKRFERGIVDIFMEDPRAFLMRIWRNAERARDLVFSSTIFPLFLFGPIVLCWFRYPWTKHRLRHEAFLLFTALPVLAFLPFHVEIRFFSPAFPALLIWLAAGLRDVAAWFLETLAHWRFPSLEERHARFLERWRSAVVLGLVFVLVLYFGVVHLQVVKRGMASLNYAHKWAGLWLKENSPRDAAIMSRDLAISLYAERGFVVSPRADYTAYLDYARRKGADYLVVDEYELRKLRPYLAFLLDTANPPPELEPVFTVKDAHGHTIVYRIKD